MTTTEEPDQVRTTGDLQLRSHQDGNAIVVTASGEIDMHSATLLSETLTELIAQGAHRVVLSMSGVSFMDSTGLGALIAAHKHARSCRGTFRIVGLTGRPAKVVELTGLDQVFSMWENIEDAVALE